MTAFAKSWRRERTNITKREPHLNDSQPEQAFQPVVLAAKTASRTSLTNCSH